MQLSELQSKMIEAMKAGDKVRKETISSIIGAVKNAAIAEHCKDNVPESLVDKILLKEQKTIQEMIDTCPADREETLAQYKERMEIVKEFAPQLISNEDVIREMVSKLCLGVGIDLTKANKGRIMKTIIPELKGKADMSIVNKCLSEMLK